MKMKPSFDRKKVPTTFKALSDFHMLRPIDDKVDFRNAQSIADVLAVLDHRKRDQDDYLRISLVAD